MRTALLASRRARRIRLCLGCLLLLTNIAGVVHAQPDPVEVLTSAEHRGVELDRNSLRAIFTMRKREWPDGTPVHVFVLADSSELHDRFAREILGIYPYVLREAWDRMVYTGTGFAPETVPSEAVMRQKIESTPGAIGYVRRTRSGAAVDARKEVSYER